MSNTLLSKCAIRAALLAPLAFACSTPPTVQYTSSTPFKTQSEYTGTWLRPSPALKERIDECASALPFTHGVEKVLLCERLSNFGESAYPVLLELCKDPRPDVAGGALAALCMTRDKRLVPALHELPWPSEEQVLLRLERARALWCLGDMSMAPHLIEGLSHPKNLVRANCSGALYEVTGDLFGYHPMGSKDDRATSIAVWEEWWALRSGPNNEVVLAQYDDQG